MSGTISSEMQYAECWPAASTAYQSAVSWLPGGNTRTQTYVAPFPMYARSGHAATIELVDGARVDDFLLNYTAATLGHAHPAVVTAITRAIQRGAPFGVPSLEEVALAEAICERFEAIERLRFTSSGSEATLQALRAARAFTNRPMVAKAEGGYHGSHDFVDISVTRFSETASSAVAEARGTPQGVTESVVVFPYNDLDGALATLAPHSEALAAVIIEPVLNTGGSIPADRAFFHGISEWCQRAEVVLIADEVATWRTGYQGAAAEYGIKPDLVCLGKPLGGGLPIGVFGGREEIIDQYDPRRPDVLRHAGTFNAHPAAMAAGLAVLEVLTPEVIERMSVLGERIAAEVVRIGEEFDVPLTSTQYRGIGRLHISHQRPRDARQAAAYPREPRIQLYRELLTRGVLIGHDGRYAISTATSDQQVEHLVQAIADLGPAVLGGVLDGATAKH